MSQKDPHTHTDLKGRNLVISIFLNIFISITQLIGGLVSGSLSLLSDALHNFSDVISLIISYIAAILVKRKQTTKKTFGYKRAEIVAAFINASTLIVVALLLVIEAIKRFGEPQTISSGWVIALAFLSIVVNGISVLLLQRDAKDNMSVKSAYLHLLSDMFTSLAVLVAGILMYYFKIYWIDGILTLIIAMYLIYMTWGLLLKSLKVLMLFTPSKVVLEDISNKICSIHEVQNIHHAHVWQLDDNNIHFEAHIDFAENMQLAKVNLILEEIRNILQNDFHIEHTTLQPEYRVCEEKDLVITDSE